MSRREKLEQIAEMERRNQMRIGAFVNEEAMLEHKRSRLAYIEGYTRPKPGMESVYKAIIARYRKELELEA